MAPFSDRHHRIHRHPVTNGKGGNDLIGKSTISILVALVIIAFILTGTKKEAFSVESNCPHGAGPVGITGFHSLLGKEGI
jgi:hypothetical protein